MIRKLKAWIDRTEMQKLYRIEFWVDAVFVSIQLVCIAIMIIGYVLSR